MRNRLRDSAALILFIVLASGCGKAGDSSSSKAGAGAPADGSTASTPDPKAVVTDFLEAMRTGNEEKALKLLTPLARQKAKETNSCPTPPASDTAKYAVGVVKYIGDDGAQVPCQWTDLDTSGQPSSTHAVWVCRHETEGWRVAGVAATVFEGEDPLQLNFEDPADMAKKKEWLRNEMDRREKAETASPQTAKNNSQAQKNTGDAFK